jgi:acyl dehydratase
MSHSSLPPSNRRYFEDYVPGAVHNFGPIHFSEADILEFGRRYDPQFFHVDAEAAAHGPYKGLIASGWHTASATMRLLVDQFVSTSASLGSPGVDELRWKLPVRPNDTLRVRVTVREATPSRSKPDRGLVRSLIEVVNQSDQVVMSMLAMNLMLRRPQSTGAPAS